jgi:hypothetical protein
MLATERQDACALHESALWQLQFTSAHRRGSADETVCTISDRGEREREMEDAICALGGDQVHHVCVGLGGTGIQGYSKKGSAIALIANRQSCSSDVRACWFPFPSSVLHRGARDLSLSSAVQCLRKHNIMLSPISNLRKNCDYRTPSTRDLLF